MCCKNLALIKSGQFFTLLSDSPLQQESEPITCIYCMLFLKLPETMDKTVILVYNRNCGSTIVLIGSLWLAQVHESHTKAQIDCSPGNITSCPASYAASCPQIYTTYFLYIGKLTDDGSTDPDPDPGRPRSVR